MSEEFKGAYKYNGTVSQRFRVKVIVNACVHHHKFQGHEGK